jgi:hypothetical protein
MVIFSSQYTLCQYNEAAALSSVMQQSTHKKNDTKCNTIYKLSLKS